MKKLSLFLLTISVCGSTVFAAEQKKDLPVSNADDSFIPYVKKMLKIKGGETYFEQFENVAEEEKFNLSEKERAIAQVVIHSHSFRENYNIPVYSNEDEEEFKKLCNTRGSSPMPIKLAAYLLTLLKAKQPLPSVNLAGYKADVEHLNRVYLDESKRVSYFDKEGVN